MNRGFYKRKRKKQFYEMALKIKDNIDWLVMRENTASSREGCQRGLFSARFPLRQGDKESERGEEFGQSRGYTEKVGDESLGD